MDENSFDRNVRQSPAHVSSAPSIAISAWDAAFPHYEPTAFGNLRTRRLTHHCGTELLHRGQPCQAVYILTSGWTCSYQTLENGDRQIVDLQLPGDFLGLENLFLHLSSVGVEAVTDVEVLEMLAADLRGALGQNNRLLNLFYHAALRDEAMVIERLTNLGRRDASQRLAHLLLETGVRLSRVGLASNAGYACPLSQDVLADVLGLSSVHVNRVLRYLREDGMVSFRDGLVSFHDYDRLVEFAEFDPGYLDPAGPLPR